MHELRRKEVLGPIKEQSRLSEVSSVSAGLRGGTRVVALRMKRAERNADLEPIRITPGGL
jgi:hypothetical protein